MRFHSLIIENITSLKGHHQIDFDLIKENSDIFAITGNTGSGKSSILAAISLALYGKHYKTNLSSSDFVTQGEKAGKIELNFSMGPKSYIATWKCVVLKKNGERKKTITPVRDIIYQNESLGPVAEKILGLSFDQFCKTVILNQGEFSSFLGSTFTDRKDILERLWGGTPLTNLSKNLRARIKSDANLLEKKRIKEDSTLPFSLEEIKTIKKEFQENQQAAEKLEELNDSLEAFKTNLYEKIKLENKKTTILKDLKELEQKIEKLKEKHNQQVEIKNKQEQEFNSFETSYKEQLPKLESAIQLQAQLKVIETNISELNSRQIKGEERLNDQVIQLSTLKKEITQLETNLKELKFDFSEVPGHFEKSIGLLLDHLRNLKNGSEELQKLNQNLNKTDQDGQELKKDNIKLQEELSSLETKDQAKELEQFYNDLLMDQRSHQTLEEKSEENKKNLPALEELFKSSDSSFQKLCQEEKNVAKSLQDKEELIDSKRNLVEIVHLLEESIDNKSCALCGSAEVLKLQKQLETSKESLLNLPLLKSERDEIKKSQVNLSKKIEMAKDNLSKVKADLDQHKKIKATILQELKALRPLDEINQLLKKTKEKIEKKQTLQGVISQNLAKLEILRSRYKEVKTQATLIEKRKTLLEKEIIKLKEALPSEFASDYSLENLPQFIDTFRTYQENHSKLVEKRKWETSLLLENENQKKDLKILANEKETKISSQQKLFSQIKELETKDDPEKLLKKLVEEREKRQKDLVQAKEEKQKDEHALNLEISMANSLGERIKEIDLLAIGHLTKALNASSIVISDGVHLGDKKEYFLKIKNIKKGPWDQDLLLETSFFYEDILLPLYEERVIELKDLKEKVIFQKANLETYEKRKKELVLVQKEIESIEKELNKLQNLEAIMGRDEFRNFALSVVEKRLLAAANRELTYLCEGRYELVHEEKKLGLDFYVVDHFQENKIRKVSTLSGGETFLVSLGLALALAEMTRGQTELDSFFIDEGFGSLDKDSIGECLDSLMALQSRGKQMGIISHVKELTDQIPSKITLHKDQFGHSEIQRF